MIILALLDVQSFSLLPFKKRKKKKRKSVLKRTILKTTDVTKGTVRPTGHQEISCRSTEAVTKCIIDGSRQVNRVENKCQKMGIVKSEV